MIKFLTTLFLFFTIALKAQAIDKIDTIYLQIEKNEVVKEIIKLKVKKNLIVLNNVDLNAVPKVNYDKTITYEIDRSDRLDRIILENTEIAPDKVFTRKGLALLIPALISTYISANTLNLYRGQEDKVLHHTIVYMLSKINRQPVKDAAAFTIIKEIGVDYLLGLGHPDIRDVGANFCGALHSKLVKNSPLDNVSINNSADSHILLSPKTNN